MTLAMQTWGRKEQRIFVLPTLIDWLAKAFGLPIFIRMVQVKGYLNDLINQRAVEFVRKNATKPFFLYVPHLAIHCPYQPPGRFEEPSGRLGI